MSGFLYYAPGRKTMTRETAESLGLGYTVEGGVTATGVQGGVVWGDATRVQPTDVHYDSDKQTWRTIPSTECQVGIWTDRRPGPSDLARREMIDGHRATLRDGNKWVVPAARRWSQDGDDLTVTCPLEHAYDIDDEGNWVLGELSEKHKRLWEIAEQWMSLKIAAVSEESSTVDVDEVDQATANDWACEALCANYVMRKPEIALLGLLDSNTVALVLDALVDLPGLAELDAESKKKHDLEAQDS